jgi:Immunity protein 53
MTFQQTKTSESSTLARLQAWYASMCNGCWEHTYGINISNIDNPGWQLRIELHDSYLAERELDPITVQRSDESDWVAYKREKLEFVAFGGPHNLDEMINFFLDWAGQA